MLSRNKIWDTQATYLHGLHAETNHQQAWVTTDTHSADKTGKIIALNWKLASYERERMVRTLPAFLTEENDWFLNAVTTVFSLNVTLSRRGCVKLTAKRREKPHLQAFDRRKENSLHACCEIWCQSRRTARAKHDVQTLFFFFVSMIDTDSTDRLNTNHSSWCQPSKIKHFNTFD